MHTTPDPASMFDGASRPAGLPFAPRAKPGQPRAESNSGAAAKRRTAATRQPVPSEPAKKSEDRALSELIRSNEFGDWLLGEVSRTAARARSANAERIPTAVSRLEALRAAKGVLLEFLILQQAMLDAASEFRNHSR